MITYWHNPRCSKSRAGLALLEARGAQLTVRKYLEDAPTEAELRSVHALLERPLADMLRPTEAQFRELGLSLSDAENDLFAAMAAHPKLIERPIAFTDTAAAIGRPSEDLLRLL
ncbi:arsenate reductase (glutaredoxin) [Pseudohalocynthiibacter aestuariivivens]|nr:arsenate reductase (glutaredoxin) [Pseudohalocynthiibacter aestuariivivens]QIE47452.1 arsenate reductase (glutaredoxin) [Pseudohalocynthiibacter aestuariivivens]